MNLKLSSKQVILVSLKLSTSMLAQSMLLVCNQEDDTIYLTEYPGQTKMYEAVTEYCGFPAIEAGKLMGLAPYGKPNDELPDFFSMDGVIVN